MRAPKGQCQLQRSEMLDHAEGWAMAAIPPPVPDTPFAERLRQDARDLGDRLARPLLCSAPVIYDGADRHRLETLQAMATAAGAGLLATTDPPALAVLSQHSPVALARLPVEGKQMAISRSGRGGAPAGQRPPGNGWRHR
jgi:error-prone DNA polymerase